MYSSIRFFLGLDRNFSKIFIILDEYRCIVDECPLDRAASLLPRLLFVVELESHGKHDHFVNVYGDVPFLYQSLIIV
jgi:hypothetical protein